MKIAELKMYQKLSASDWGQIRKELSDLGQHRISTVPHTSYNAKNHPIIPFVGEKHLKTVLDLELNKYTIVTIQKVISDKGRNIRLNNLKPELVFFVETEFNNGAFIDLKKIEAFSKKVVAKTPLQELFEIIERAQWPQQLIKELLLNRKQLLKREKFLISTSYDNGQLHCAQKIRKSGEEYYEENFNNQ